MTNNYSAVRKIANRVSKIYSATPPVDVEAILHSCSIVEDNNNPLGIEAYTLLNESPPRVQLNNSIMTFEPRKRFTIAHELGHIFIPWHNGEISCNTDDPRLKEDNLYFDTQELEAYAFASELLMPTQWILEKFNIGQTFESLIDVMAREANASIMACLYAVENALPSGHAFFITSNTMDFWKSFHTIGTCTWKIFSRDLSLLEKISIKKEAFQRGNYQIFYYNFLPIPTNAEIRSAYQQADGDLGKALCNLTGFFPERLLHCLNVLVEAFDDDFYLVFETLEQDYLHLITRNCYIRLDRSQPFDTLWHQISMGNTQNTGVLTLPVGRLFWIKQEKYQPASYSICDSKQLLKYLLSNYYPAEEAHKHLLYINGVIGNSNTKKDKTQIELYQYLKSRFSQDQKIPEITNDPLFDTFLQNRIQEIMRRR